MAHRAASLTTHCAPDAAVSDAPLACGSFCGMRVGDFFVVPFDEELVPVVPPALGVLMPVPPWPAVPPPPPPPPPAPAPPAPCATAVPQTAKRIAEQTAALLVALMIASLIDLTRGQHRRATLPSLDAQFFDVASTG
ncbi:hypothetical protein Bphyt_5728 [Paraburkholderia phytofirmans PsJN]|uniref:Uncharacterized protein n=1 Tax=Paraburkholderia phytofirmans (strain DSM 17436 / LMG 22146 / PsJN) TaxID=398527 RepID=B2TFR0_PARPJ|nr:hypothetical protein Bphyt_5728 [Paraburkholderia phytofirmans PsJN]